MELRYIKELYYTLTKQRFIPINNIFYQGKRIHFDRFYKSHCILNNGSGIAYLNQEQEETIRKMLEEDKKNGSVGLETIIRRCCVCHRTEQTVTSNGFFSDGILSFECFRKLYSGQLPESEINEILSSSNGKRIYETCKDLYSGIEGANNDKRTASIHRI